MPHIFEAATSGRSKCRGCGRAIPRGELRFGERLPNPFADGEMTLWFHPACAARKRPEPFLESLGETAQSIPDRQELERIARNCVAHHRLPRIDGAERSPSGQAICRSCREPIARGNWRLRLVFYEEGLFSPGGFVHLDCRKAKVSGTFCLRVPDTLPLLDHVLHFSPALEDGEREELRRAWEAVT